MEKNTPILKMTWSTSGRSLNCRQVLTSRGPWPLDTSTPHITGCSLWKTWKREDEITDQDKILQLIFVSKGGQCQKTNKKKKNHASKYFFLLLVEMADECRFDLQLEFMLLIVRVGFVVLQTRSVRDEVILFDRKSTFWIAHQKIIITQKRNLFTVWEGRVGHTADPERCYMSKQVPAHGEVFGVGSLAPADQPLCSGNSTAD